MRRTAAMLMLTIVSLPVQAANLFEIYRLAQSNDPTFEAARTWIGEDEVREEVYEALVE